MTRRVVCGSSAVVAMLLDAGRDGQWATAHLDGAELFAPTLLHFESANVLRRLELSGAVSADQAVQAHADLGHLPVELWPYDLMASRVWELRSDLSCYDAAYVALAELIDAPFVTLDRRVAGAPGLRCAVTVPTQA